MHMRLKHHTYDRNVDTTSKPRVVCAPGYIIVVEHWVVKVPRLLYGWELTTGKSVHSIHVIYKYNFIHSPFDIEAVISKKTVNPASCRSLLENFSIV